MVYLFVFLTILQTLSKQVATIRSIFIKNGLNSCKNYTTYLRVFSLRYQILDGMLGMILDSYLDIYFGLRNFIRGFEFYFGGNLILFDIYVALCVLFEEF